MEMMWEWCMEQHNLKMANNEKDWLKETDGCSVGYYIISGLVCISLVTYEQH